MELSLKRAWIDALIDGHSYRQAQGKLKAYIEADTGTIETGAAREHIDDSGTVGYCCLGVLLDIAFKRNDLIGQWSHPVIYDDETGEESTEDDAWTCPFNNGENLLSDDALLSLGLTDEMQNKLAAANDGGNNFAQIAMIIEREVEVGVRLR